MPVSVITDIVTWAELIGQLLLTGTELYVLTYLVFGGGWLDMIRLISFWLDKILLKYIDQFYSYFEKILGGQIFAPDVINDVMSRVYIFVSLFAVLKLLMLLMKYLISPELVSDDKVGTSALIKRVITGMCGMLFLPTIFDLALGVQKAVLNDNLFGKVLLSEDGVKEFEKYDTKIGRLLAFNVHQAFWSLDKNRVTDKNIQKKYDQAIKAMDPNVAGDINVKFNGDYAFDYFPIASSVVLVYVLYLVIKYCIDVVVRMFKLFLLQMMGPLAISDYMINGDSKEMFKNWLKTTISVYAMLFVRIFSIWFIAFVAVLMNKNCTTVGADGICEDSLLYISNGNTDYLLRGIIVLGLLAVLMDLPKFFSDLFGLDLEQDATVKGLMQKVGGAAKGVAMGGLAVGGAAIGGAIGSAKAAGKTLNQATGLGSKLGDKMKNSKLGQKIGNSKAMEKLHNSKLTAGARALNQAASDNNLKEHRNAALGGIVSAAMNSNSVTGTAYKGYSAQQQEQKGIDSKAKQESKEREKEAQAQKERKEDVYRNVIERLAETADRNVSKEDFTMMARAQIYGDPGEVTAKVRGILDSSGISDVGEVTQTVKQVLGEKFNVAPDEVEQVVKQVVKDPANVTPGEVEQIVNQVIGQRAEADQTITQVVNQVYGTRVNNAVEDATQKVTQEIEQSIDVQKNLTEKIEQQVNISREINDEVKTMNTNIEEIHVFTDLTAEYTENMKNNMNNRNNN